TNSIGWAVVETNDNKKFELLHKGVHIFQEGVKIEKGIEGSKAEERTGYRSARRLKFRRKLRKISTLKVLIENDYCPKLTNQELKDWRYKKIYPSNDEFRKWLATDDNMNKNPYYFRNLVVTKKLDLSSKENRYKLGRAFYHLSQRRGFLSNRLESTKESDGAIKKAISELTKLKNDKTIGQYFFDKYNSGEKIRNQYTHREDHYLEEFNKICEVQNIDSSIKESIYKAIFYQRPLKSQKGLIGKCPFEKNKQRCSTSHPLFEEYRMLCFVNNIKIKTPKDEKLRFLNQEERNKILPLFYRKSKEHFDFEDIAKHLAPKKQYKFYKTREKYPEDYLFNYSMKTTVYGCPVSARFESIFGENWKELNIKHKRKSDNKESYINIYDVWHVLYTFDSVEKLNEFALEKLGLKNEKLKEFNNINLKHDYASLSLKAIKKVLPFLQEGLIYSHAIFLANMGNAISHEIWSKEENRKIIQQEILEIIQNQNQEKNIVEVVNGLIKKCKENKWYWSDEASEQYKKDIEKNIKTVFGTQRWEKFDIEAQNDIVNNALIQFKEQIQKQNGKLGFLKIETIDERIKSFLEDNFDANKEDLKKLYHPSAIEVFKQPKRADDGRKYLGSPMVSSVRNPMAMRALHQLRKLINELIKQDLVDENTKVNIEMSRDLKNANERKALKRWQDDREKLHKEYFARIKEHFDENGIKREPSETDILKYQLWEEQEHKCIYTGESIGISDFLGSNPSFDIEHTIPRSLSYDNSQQNKTLCQNRFNREIKRNKIPAELSNHAEILERIEKWKEKYEELDVKIQKLRKVTTSDRSSKDRVIQKKHIATIERDYWKNKYERFTMPEVKAGFKNSQMVDIGIITKYSRLYLKTLFNKVYTVKGNTVADFRRLWGLQDEYEKKARVNHIHHCIDAITIACMT
ncbi:MAG: type II CRISPR RNA-guided endonuclease Cas9, partial [Mariniphaga sp.]